MKIIELNFNGYRRESKKARMEQQGGIYCVYAGTYDAKNDTVNVQKLLYIGKADCIDDRIGNDSHEHLEDWKKEVKFGQELIYSRAILNNADDRTIAEAAMIYKFQPPVNIAGKDGFHHQTTMIKTSGKNALLDKEFTVHNTD